MISVIIPSINRDTLGAALSSVKQQFTTEEVEICLEINEPDSENPIQAISAIRNRLIKNSNGKWLAFLDDDDRYLPNHLSNLDDSYDVILSPCQRTWNLKSEEVLDKLKTGYSFASSATIIKKDRFEEIGGFNELLPHSEMWDVLVKILLKTPEKVLVRNEPSWFRGLNSPTHYGQRYHNDFLTNDRKKWLSDLLV